MAAGPSGQGDPTGYRRGGRRMRDLGFFLIACADDIDRVLALGIGTKRTADGWEDVALTDSSRRNIAVALRAVAVALER